MKCENCGAVNPEYANFCGDCGQPVRAPVATNADQERPVYPPPVSDRLPASEPPPGVLPERTLPDLMSGAARLYLGNLPLFLGIGLVSQLPALLGLAVSFLPLEILLFIIEFVLVALTQGALVYAVAGMHLGLPVSMADCFSRSRTRAPALIICWGLFAATLLLFAVLSVFIIGIPLIFVLVIMGFYPQTVMIENRRAIEALRRSALLVRGSWWRVFGIGLAYGLPIVAPLLVIFAQKQDFGSSLLEGLILSLVSAAALPWLIIGSTLLYFDLRVRKEHFTLQTLSSEPGITTP